MPRRVSAIMQKTEAVKALVRARGKHKFKGHQTQKKTRKVNGSMLATKNQRSVTSRRVFGGRHVWFRDLQDLKTLLWITRKVTSGSGLIISLE